MHRRSRLHIGHVRWSHRRWRDGKSTALGPSFAKIWGAGAVSNLADGVTFAALPLLTALLTRDALSVAFAAFMHSLPWFGFELIAGELVDRFDRKRLMFWGNLARAGIVGAVALLVAADQLSLPILYGLAFSLGVAETLVDTSWEALVPRLVQSEDLEVAFGRTQATEWTANEMIGPPLGGVLFVGAAAAPFFLNAGGFVIAAVLIAWIPGVYRAEREIAHGRGSMRKEISEGVTWLWRHKVLRTLSLMAGTANLVGTATFAVFVLYAQEILDLSDAGYGSVLAAAGIGGIIGAVTAHRVESRLGPGTVLLVSMGGIGIAALIVAITSAPWVVAIAFAVDGFLVGLWNVVVVSLRQMLTPDDIRGRVASVTRTLAFGAIPLGAALGGVLADQIGLRSPYFLQAAVYAAAVPLMAGIVSNGKIAALKAEISAEA